MVHPEGDVTFMFPQGGDVPRNLVCSGTSDFGDLDEAFAQSDIVFERTYTSQATQTAPMETFRAFATTDAFGRISVTTSTQVPFHVRRMVAQSLDIPQSQVQVIKPRIGGGFGSKQTGCCEIFVAFVTQQTGRPSYCCYTREETITAGNSRHQMQMTVKLGAMNDGTITAIDLHTLSNAGAYGEHATTTIGLSGHKSLPIYNHVKASRFSWDASTPTPTAAARIAVTVPPRASLPWRAPSTSSPTSCTWTPPICALRTSCARARSCRSTTTRSSTPARSTAACCARWI